MDYSFKKGLTKGVISFVVFAAPVLLLQYPAFAELTLGAVLTIGVNYLKVRYLR